MHFNVIRVDEAESTNAEAKVLGYSGAVSGTVVVAKRQTKGRGRQGKTWISGEGNLLFSIMLKPNCSPPAAAEIGFVIAVSMQRAIMKLLPMIGNVTFKWPNDVLLNGKKVCGILLESDMQANRVLNMVAGIGVNVGSFPASGVDYEATSLDKESGLKVDVDTLLQQFLDFFAADYEAWQRDGFGTYHKIWNQHAAGLGDVITVKTDKGEVSGVFKGIRDSGALILRLDTGEDRSINTGDVYFTRSQGADTRGQKKKANA